MLTGSIGMGNKLSMLRVSDSYFRWGKSLPYDQRGVGNLNVEPRNHECRRIRMRGARSNSSLGRRTAGNWCGILGIIIFVADIGFVGFNEFCKIAV